MAKLSFAEKFKGLFKTSKIDSEFFETLTDILVEGDVGARMAFELTEKLEDYCSENKVTSEDEVKLKLKEYLSEYAKKAELPVEENKVNLFMLLGVNGVGKTTSAAKISKIYKEKGNTVILAASDTFRAAAEEQLEMHGQRLGIRVVSHQHGSDPSSVVFDATEALKAQGGGLVIADTAGRLHNKENLVKELQKIDRIAKEKSDAGCYRKILVIDGTTGQNAVRQAEVFHEAVGLDAVVITKYDSTAKGGIIFTIGKTLGIPVAYVCTGEKYEDIKPFDPQEFISQFLG